MPLGTNVHVAANQEITDNFLNDPLQWEVVTNRPIIHVSPDFAERIFGTADNPIQSSLDLLDQYEEENIIRGADDSFDPNRVTELKDQMASRFLEEAQGYFSEEDIGYIAQMTTEQRFQLFERAHNMYELRHVESPRFIVMGSANTMELSDGSVIGIVTIGDVEDFSFENITSERFASAFGDTIPDLDPEIARARILLHELEHLEQGNINAAAHEHELSGNHASYYQELDADISASQNLERFYTREDIMRDEAFVDVSYLHKYVRDLGEDQSSIDVLGESTHNTRAQMSEFFERNSLSGTFDDVHNASLSLADRIMMQMGVSDTDQIRMNQLFEEQGYPTLAQINQALRELVSNEDEPLENQEMLLASSFLESLDNLGVGTENYTNITNSEISQAQVVGELVDAATYGAFFDNNANQSPPAPGT